MLDLQEHHAASFTHSWIRGAARYFSRCSILVSVRYLTILLSSRVSSCTKYSSTSSSRRYITRESGKVLSKSREVEVENRENEYLVRFWKIQRQSLQLLDIGRDHTDRTWCRRLYQVQSVWSRCCQSSWQSIVLGSLRHQYLLQFEFASACGSSNLNFFRNWRKIAKIWIPLHVYHPIRREYGH